MKNEYYNSDYYYYENNNFDTFGNPTEQKNERERIGIKNDHNQEG